MLQIEFQLDQVSKVLKPHLNSMDKEACLRSLFGWKFCLSISGRLISDVSLNKNHIKVSMWMMVGWKFQSLCNKFSLGTYLLIRIYYQTAKVLRSKNAPPHRAIVADQNQTDVALLASRKSLVSLLTCKPMSTGNFLTRSQHMTRVFSALISKTRGRFTTGFCCRKWKM